VELMDLECIEIDQSGIDIPLGMSAAAVQGSATPAWPLEGLALASTSARDDGPQQLMILMMG